MVPAPTGLPTIVRSIPRAAFRSIIPSISARLGGIGKRRKSSGEVTCPWTSMVIRLTPGYSGAGRSEHLAAVGLDRRDDVTEVREVRWVELRHLEPVGRLAGVEEPAIEAAGRAEHEPARSWRLDL